MIELGWSKAKAKWGGADYARALWVRPGFTVDRGRVIGADGEAENLALHLHKLEREEALL